MNKADFNYLTGVTMTNCSASRQNSFIVSRIIKDLLEDDLNEDVVEDLKQIQFELETLNNHLSNARKSQEKLRKIHQDNLDVCDLINYEEISNEVKTFQGELV